MLSSYSNLYRCTTELQYKSSCTVLEVLKNEEFDEMVAHMLPWQIESILDDPLCNDSSEYQHQLAEIVLDLRNFSVFYENDSLRCDLIRYPL